MSAIFSKCKKYRYLLERTFTNIFGDHSNLLFIMLNPSTADEIEDDPTIRRCIDFAKRNDKSGLVVGNLYAYRATDPDELKKVHDPVGPENDEYLQSMALKHVDVVIAWGSNADVERANKVIDIFESKGCRLWCLGINQNGSPKHPLYINKGQPLIKFTRGEPDE